MKTIFDKTYEDRHNGVRITVAQVLEGSDTFEVMFQRYGQRENQFSLKELKFLGACLFAASVITEMDEIYAAHLAELESKSKLIPNKSKRAI